MSTQTDTTPVAPTDRARLRMTGIRKSYPGTLALDGASLEVAPGEVHCLLGENGAGKSTLMRVLAGAVTQDAGEISLDGVPQVLTSPHAGIKAGISVIYQELDLVPDLTVAQNLFLGAAPASAGLVRRRDRDRRAREALDSVGAKVSPTALVRDLSVAHQQLVAIARSLTSDASVIVMDEPSATLTASDLPRIFALVRRLAEQGRSVVYITHRLEEVLEIGDRATVMRDGQTVGTFRVAETSHEELVTAIIGHRPATTTRPPVRPTGPPAVHVARAHVRGLIDVRDITVHPGQVVGLAGLGGSGRTTLLMALFGAIRSSLDATVGGRRYHPTRPSSAVRAGVGLVPEDRKNQGLLRDLSVARNAGLASLPATALLPRRRSREITAGPLRDLRTKFASPEQAAGQLSGGNQQKVVLAKWLTRGVDVLLLDEPTRGIDIGAKAELYRQVHRLADQGAAVLMASSELGELYANADEIWVMFEGRNVARFEPASATEDEIARTVITGKADPS